MYAAQKRLKVLKVQYLLFRLTGRKVDYAP